MGPSRKGGLNVPDDRQTRIDTQRPNSARFWNYLLGGKDNYAVDREFAQRVLDRVPQLRAVARADRAFLERSVHFLVTDLGIRQFLDIGTGLPTANNTHEVAQRAASDSRVVYVDNDPVVLVHARALLTSSPEGATDYVEADARDVDSILHAAAATLDFDRPIAVMMLGVLEFIPDQDVPHAIVERLMAATCSGSCLVIAHACTANHDVAHEEALQEWRRRGGPSLTMRSPEEIGRFFSGLEVLDPGVVSCSEWRGDGGGPSIEKFAGVGLKRAPGSP